MPFTAPSTPRCPPPDVCRPVEYAGPDMPFTASSALQCPEYIPPSMTQSTADSHSQFHPSQLGPSLSRKCTDKVTLLSSADTPKSIPGSQPAPRGGESCRRPYYNNVLCYVMFITPGGSKPKGPYTALPNQYIHLKHNSQKPIQITFEPMT